jgi:hypothetical protein
MLMGLDIMKALVPGSNDCPRLLRDPVRLRRQAGGVGRGASLNARINNLRAMTISTSGRAKAAVGEMHRILDAIRERDADGAYRASADHVRKVAELAYRGQ